VTRGLVKVAAFEAIHRRIAETTHRPLILCGDFNTPKHEAPDGRITTWAESHPAHRARWERAELSVLTGLGVYGLRDVFRGLHGHGPQPVTWMQGRTGRRYDHVFASQDLATESCDYIHEWRTDRLSDHSAIKAVFAPAAA
jgi:endonuclease/exonuclease/phosphatase family metal-dependent hydrolase